MGLGSFAFACGPSIFETGGQSNDSPEPARGRAGSSDLPPLRSSNASQNEILFPPVLLIFLIFKKKTSLCGVWLLQSGTGDS